MGLFKDAKRGVGERVGHKITDGGTNLLGWGARKAGAAGAFAAVVFAGVTFLQTLASDERAPTFRELYFGQAKENVAGLWGLAVGDDAKASPDATLNNPEPGGP